MNKYNRRTKERSMKEVVANNVIHLNRSLSNADLINAENAIETAKQIRIDLAEDISEFITENIVGMLTPYGILANSNKTDIRDIIMIEQAVASALYRYYGLEHPLHDVTDEVIELPGEEDEEE